MNPSEPAGTSTVTNGPSARRVLAWALIIQSLATLVLTTAALVAPAGVDARFLLLLGVLAVVGVATALATWLSIRVFGPLEQLVAQAENLAQGRSTVVTSVGSASMQPGDISRLSIALNTLQSKKPNDVASSADRLFPVAKDDSGAAISSLLQAVPWAVWITDRDGLVTHYNALMAELFESDSGSLRGYPTEPWFTRRTKSETWTELHHSVVNGTPWRGEIEAVSETGDVLRMELTAAPVESSGAAQDILFLAEDVTEIRQLGKVLIDLERQSTRGEMAGEVAHEINNFLTILGGNLDIIPMLLATGKHEKVEAKFVAMRQVLDKIARFSDGLMGPRGMGQEASECDINRLIENLSEFLKPQNRFDGVELAVRLDPDMPKVSVRVGEINQVLVNLLNNAADAIHQDGRREGRVEVSTRHLRDQKEFAVMVRDNGPGLSTNASEHIFRDRYSDKKSGHGLGLLNCHAIARGHGGQLTVETTPGQGTSFTLKLPCSGASERETASALSGMAG